MLSTACYASRSFTNIQQRRSAQRSDHLNKAAGARMLRHHVSGDFVKADGTLDIDYMLDVFVFHVMHPEVQGWVYTHAITDIIAAGFTPLDVPRNLALIASCDSPEDYVVAKAYGWRTARVSSDGKATAFGEVSCLNDTRGLTCAECKICLPGRKADIVFKLKGKRKEKHVT